PLRRHPLLPGFEAHPRDRPLRRRRHLDGAGARRQAPDREVRDLMADDYDQYGAPYEEYQEQPEPERPRLPGSDVEQMLRRLHDLVSSARPMPLSTSVMVNRDEVLDLLDETIERLPDEL